MIKQVIFIFYTESGVKRKDVYTIVQTFGVGKVGMSLMLTKDVLI